MLTYRYAITALPIALLWFVWSVIPYSPQHYLHIFDVGRGQSILWVHGKHAILLDTGDAGYAYKIAGYLRKNAIRLDAIFLSHHDKDHTGALDQLLGFLKDPTAVWMPEGSRSLPYLHTKVHRTQVCKQGLKMEFGNYFWTVIHPDNGIYNSNDRSCVWYLSGPEKWLFPGDISSRIERRLLPLIVPVTGLILSHHGSLSSNDHLWLATLRPKKIIVSTHAKSWPKKLAVIKRLPVSATELYVTAGQGDIHITLQSEL